jgi:hypothetical protein
MSANFISDILDYANSAIVEPITTSLPHVKQVFLARMNVEETEENLRIQYRTQAGDTYSSIADTHFVEPSLLVKNNPANEIFEELPANRRVRINTKHREVSFEPAEYAEVGEVLYLVVETENFRVDDNDAPRRVKVQLMNGPGSVLGAADSAIEFTHEGEQKDALEIEVGQFLLSSDFVNKDEFSDFAIARITLAGSDDSKKQWLQDIGNIADEGERYAPIYFKADAHSINTDIPEILFSYYGEVDGEQISDKFWYGDGRFFELDNTGVPWMKHAIEDAHAFMGLDEDDAILKTKVENQYFPICGRKLGGSWCAAFVSHMLYRSNYSKLMKSGSVDFANSSKMVKIDRPVYGAISVWQNFVRSGADATKFDTEGNAGLQNTTVRFDGVEYRKIYRGHIGLVYGKRRGSSDGHYLILGGNQKDKIMVREYDCTGTAFDHTVAYGPKIRGKRKHIGFFIPLDYALSLQDGLDSPSADLEQRVHWLHNHLHDDFEAANLAATGLAMDAGGENRDI